jgi:hypothetical protein
MPSLSPIARRAPSPAGSCHRPIHRGAAAFDWHQCAIWRRTTEALTSGTARYPAEAKAWRVHKWSCDGQMQADQEATRPRSVIAPPASSRSTNETFPRLRHSFTRPTATVLSYGTANRVQDMAAWCVSPRQISRPSLAKDCHDLPQRPLVASPSRGLRSRPDRPPAISAGELEQPRATDGGQQHHRSGEDGKGIRRSYDPDERGGRSRRLHLPPDHRRVPGSEGHRPHVH